MGLGLRVRDLTFMVWGWSGSLNFRGLFVASTFETAISGNSKVIPKPNPKEARGRSNSHRAMGIKLKQKGPLP